PSDLNAVIKTITATPTATPMVIMMDCARPSRKKLTAIFHSIQSRPNKFFHRSSPVIHFCYWPYQQNSAMNSVVVLSELWRHLPMKIRHLPAPDHPRSGLILLPTWPGHASLK